MGRIQNFGSWSPYLVKDGRTCLGLEYFVFEGDEHVDMADDDLIALGTKELVHLGLVAAGRRRARLRGARAQGLPVLRLRLQGATSRPSASGSSAEAPNVHPVGRNGMHKYNNQDHSMYTAMLTVENIVRRRPRHLGGERRGGVPRESGSTGRDAPVLPRRHPHGHGADHHGHGHAHRRPTGTLDPG